MSELVYISKDLHSNRRRAKSSCSRCSQNGERRQLSPGRGTYLSSAKGRNLSLEIDGRQGRNNRRSSSNSRDTTRKDKGPLHCYVISNGSVDDKLKSPTTYKEAFCSPTDQRMSRTPDSRRPIFPSSKSAFFSSSPRQTSTPPKSSSLSFDLTDSITSSRSSPISRPSRLPVSRSTSVQNGFVYNSPETTYRDHFTWRY